MGLVIGIAGGGIAGLTLAAGLQAMGVEVIVLERQAEVRDTGAGISLWPNALAALDGLDLGVLVRSLGRSLAAGGDRRLDGRAMMTFTARRFEGALGEGLVCVDRGELVRALGARLRPGTVRTGCLVTGYRVGPSGVTVRLATGGDGGEDGEDGEGGEGGEGVEVVVDALVGADGINSAVARQLSGPLPSSYSGYTAWRGIAETSGGSNRNELWACLAGGHEVGWLPVAEDRTYWFATAWLPEGHAFPQGDAAYLEETFGRWPQPIPALLAATPADRLVRSDITDRAMPERWSRGPVTLMGDAAHPMRPHLGQGGCQAIEDAAVLAGCLVAERGDPAGAFARYERRRRARARRIVRLSRAARLTLPPGATTTVFDRLTSYLPALPVGPPIRQLSPIAGYRAGQRATQTSRRA